MFLKNALYSIVLILTFSACTEQTAQIPIARKPKEFLRNQTITSAFEDNDGNMWFGTNYEGIYRYDGNNFEHFQIEDGGNTNTVYAITQDNSGALWLATKDGLCRFENGKFEHVEIPWDGNQDLWGPGLNAKQCVCIFHDSSGKIWFGTWGNGVHCFDPLKKDAKGNYKFKSYLQDKGMLYGDNKDDHRNVIQNIIEDKAGNLWLSSMSHGGVFKYDGSTFQQYSLEEGLPDDMVFTVQEDSFGHIWLGMLGNREGGLVQYDGKQFRNFTTKNGLPNNNVTDILDDGSGILWVGSHRSYLFTVNLHSLDSKKNPEFKAILTQNGEKIEGVNFITADSKGKIWFGGAFASLYCYNGERIIDYTQEK